MLTALVFLVLILHAHLCSLYDVLPSFLCSLTLHSAVALKGVLLVVDQQLTDVRTDPERGHPDKVKQSVAVRRQSLNYTLLLNINFKKKNCGKF